MAAAFDGPTPGQECEHLGRRGVEVHDALDGLAGARPPGGQREQKTATAARSRTPRSRSRGALRLSAVRGRRMAVCAHGVDDAGHAPATPGRTAGVAVAAVAVARAGPCAVAHLGRPRRAEPHVEAHLVGRAVVGRAVRADRQGVRVASLPAGSIPGQIGSGPASRLVPASRAHPAVGAAGWARQPLAILAVGVTRLGRGTGPGK